MKDKYLAFFNTKNPTLKEVRFIKEPLEIYDDAELGIRFKLIHSIVEKKVIHCIYEEYESIQKNVKEYKRSKSRSTILSIKNVFNLNKLLFKLSKMLPLDILHDIECMFDDISISINEDKYFKWLKYLGPFKYLVFFLITPIFLLLDKMHDFIAYDLKWFMQRMFRKLFKSKKSNDDNTWHRVEIASGLSSIEYYNTPNIYFDQPQRTPQMTAQNNERHLQQMSAAQNLIRYQAQFQNPMLQSVYNAYRDRVMNEMLAQLNNNLVPQDNDREDRE